MLISSKALPRIKTGPPIKYIEKRPYVVSPGVKYVLPSDDHERKRLNIQQRGVKAIFDGKNVLSPVSFVPGDHILDCATGTGIWLLEVAPTLPDSVSLYGVDIVPRLFPSPEDIPKNVEFHIENLMALPPDWSDKFKLIHQRLLIVALQRTQWPLVIQELFRVTKPGGWIELCELEDWTAGTTTERHRGVIRALCEYRGLFLECAKHIPTMLAEAGFVNITVHSRSGTLAGDAGADIRTGIQGAWAGTKAPVLDVGAFGLVHSEEEFDQLLKDLEREWKETPEAVSHWVTVSAQKL